MIKQKYRSVYAPLLLDHMSQGHSLAAFAALEVSKQELLAREPVAPWIKSCRDFRKERVSRTTVYAWLKQHAGFARTYEQGRDAGLLFYERHLLAMLKGEKANARSGARLLVFVLQKRFADVYGEQGEQVPEIPRKKDEEAFPDITQINDPDELLRLARRCNERENKRRRKRDLPPLESRRTKTPEPFAFDG
ncbi:MAG: hypothetical protein AAF471_09350 [Myxococcota bacterium]